MRGAARPRERDRQPALYGLLVRGPARAGETTREPRARGGVLRACAASTCSGTGPGSTAASSAGAPIRSRGRSLGEGGRGVRGRAPATGAGRAPGVAGDIGGLRPAPGAYAGRRRVATPIAPGRGRAAARCWTPSWPGSSASRTRSGRFLREMKRRRGDRRENAHEYVHMDVLVSLSKRRGFIFQSSEIYGGTGSCWDYGPLGVELKNNIKRVWWRDFVQPAPRHGRARRVDPHAPDGLEGERPPRALHRTRWWTAASASGGSAPTTSTTLPWLHFCPATKGNKFDDPGRRGRASHCGAAPHAVPGVRQGRADRAAAVQPHVQDVHGAGRGGRRA